MLTLLAKILPRPPFYNIKINVTTKITFQTKMSSRNAKKNVPATKSTNTVVTRKKSAQQNRQPRAKNKKVAKPVVDKEPPKPETKSTKTCNATCVKDTPLKTKVKNLVQLVEQVEYYPDKLKRAMCAKKVFLKPKHNFKVIAVANKRKLNVPQKEGKPYIIFFLKIR